MLFFAKFAVLLQGTRSEHVLGFLVPNFLQSDSTCVGPANDYEIRRAR